MKKLVLFIVSLVLVFSLAFVTSVVAEGQGEKGEGTQAEKLKREAKVKAVDADTLSQKTPSGELEIFSWWAGTEGPALKALINLYEEKYPDSSVTNATVAGGSGINAKAVLKTRMLGGDPPDSFQVHAGRELIGTWVTANRMQDLTPLFEQEGFMDAFPDSLIKLISTDRGIWSVPLTIHRSNLLWYIPANIEKWGVEPPRTWEEFLEIAPELEEQGVTPLSIARNWTVNHLWESVALAVMGPEDWQGLWEGDVPFNSDKVVESWKLLDQIMEYVNDDYSSLSWQQATDRVINGEAAFNVMGDWAAGYMSTVKNLTPEEEFGWVPSPDTSGEFMLLSDSFGMPIGVPHPVNSYHWLALLGSKEGSDTFNPKKGSISPRLDSDLSKYNDYSQSAAEDFQNDTLVGSLAHGLVANEGFMNDFSTVMEMFLRNRDPQQAANALDAIARQNDVTNQ